MLIYVSLHVLWLHLCPNACFSVDSLLTSLPISLSLNFLPASKLPCHRPNSSINQPFGATHIHSIQKDTTTITKLSSNLVCKQRWPCIFYLFNSTQIKLTSSYSVCKFIICYIWIDMYQFWDLVAVSTTNNCKILVSVVINIQLSCQVCTCHLENFQRKCESSSYKYV